MSPSLCPLPSPKMADLVLCSWGTSSENPPTVRIGTCIQGRRLCLGLGPSLSVYSVCRLLWQQLRLTSEARSRNQSTLCAKKILTQPWERRGRLARPSPGSPGSHLGLRSLAWGQAHGGYPVSTCRMSLVLACAFFAFILPHPAPPAVCSLYSPFHERTF